MSLISNISSNMTNMVNLQEIMGAKNLIPFMLPVGSHNRGQGITYTVNKNRSVTCNGSTGTEVADILLTSIVDSGGAARYATIIDDYFDTSLTYIAHISTSDVGIRLRILLYDSANTQIDIIDTGTYKTFKFSDYPTAKTCRITLRTGQNLTINNKTVYPMIVPKELYDRSNKFKSPGLTNFAITKYFMPSYHEHTYKGILIRFTKVGNVVEVVVLGTATGAITNTDVMVSIDDNGMLPSHGSAYIEVLKVNGNTHDETVFIIDHDDRNIYLWSIAPTISTGDVIRGGTMYITTLANELDDSAD